MFDINKVFEGLFSKFSDLNSRLSNLETYEQAAGGATYSGVHAYLSSASYSIAGGANINWNAESWDTDDYHVAGSHQFTIPYDGRYVIRSKVYYNIGTATQPKIQIHVSSAFYVHEYGENVGTSIGHLPVESIWDLSAGDIVHIYCTDAAGAFIFGTDPYDSFCQIELLAAA